jgi:hypothetical protein
MCKNMCGDELISWLLLVHFICSFLLSCGANSESFCACVVINDVEVSGHDEDDRMKEGRLVGSTKYDHLNVNTFLHLLATLVTCVLG